MQYRYHRIFIAILILSIIFPNRIITTAIVLPILYNKYIHAEHMTRLSNNLVWTPQQWLMRHNLTRKRLIWFKTLVWNYSLAEDAYHYAAYGPTPDSSGVPVDPCRQVLDILVKQQLDHV